MFIYRIPYVSCVTIAGNNTSITEINLVVEEQQM